MRNSKKIHELETKIIQLELSYRKLKFAIEHPPIYKKGDNYKGGIIHESFVTADFLPHNYTQEIKWYYSYIEKGTGDIIQIKTDERKYRYL